MNIKPNALTLEQFFTGGNEQFIIPPYQRRYAWGLRQQKELFDDIDLLNENDSHLLGTVVFITNTHTPGINMLELVDGQQRITTLTILLHVLKNKFKHNCDEEDETKKADEIKEIERFLRCRGNDRKNLLKLRPGDLDFDDYSKIMSDESIDEVKNKKLSDAYKYFSKRLDDFNVDQLQKFYVKLLRNTQIIRLDVGDAKNAYKLFETINNRGLQLSSTDVIKNFILGHASLLGDEVLVKVRKYWGELVSDLDGLNSDDFFRQYLASKLSRAVSAGGLVHEFDNLYRSLVKEANILPGKNEKLGGLITPSDEDESEINKNVTVEVVNKIKITEYVRQLRQAAKGINQRLENLKKIKSTQTHSFLLHMFQRDGLNEKVLLKILENLESFMMRRHICGDRTNELEHLFPKLTLISASNFELDVAKELKKHINSDADFQKSFANFRFVTTVIDRARYALEMIEYKKIRSKKEYVLAAPQDLELEHIIPKAIKSQNGKWIEYLGEGCEGKHDEYLHRIGNMTLIADELNASASNSAFNEKKKIYKQSAITLTKELADMSSFKFKAVKTRSEELAKIAVKIWTI
jgi:uncharacterized protein with ParB-like and HNH nuclease domain